MSLQPQCTPNGHLNHDTFCVSRHSRHITTTIHYKRPATTRTTAPVTPYPVHSNELMRDSYGGEVICLGRTALARAVLYPLRGCTTVLYGWILLTGDVRLPPPTYPPETYVTCCYSNRGFEPVGSDTRRFTRTTTLSGSVFAQPPSQSNPRDVRNS